MPLPDGTVEDYFAPASQAEEHAPEAAAPLETTPQEALPQDATPQDATPPLSTKAGGQRRRSTWADEPVEKNCCLALQASSELPSELSSELSSASEVLHATASAPSASEERSRSKAEEVYETSTIRENLPCVGEGEVGEQEASPGPSKAEEGFGTDKLRETLTCVGQDSMASKQQEGAFKTERSEPAAPRRRRFHRRQAARLGRQWRDERSRGHQQHQPGRVLAWRPKAT